MNRSRRCSGQFLIEPEAITRVIPLIKPDYFYLPEHRENFRFYGFA
ncbi:MAG: DnaB-like helicase N-terminal domain-containing protein [Acutalibacteraceae bacterium]